MTRVKTNERIGELLTMLEIAVHEIENEAFGGDYGTLWSVLSELRNLTGTMQ